MSIDQRKTVCRGFSAVFEELDRCCTMQSLLFKEPFCLSVAAVMASL